MPGPAQTMFFAPTQIEKRREEWSPGVIEAKLDTAWVPFTERVTDWIEIQHGTGVDAVGDVYVEMLETALVPIPPTCCTHSARRTRAAAMPGPADCRSVTP